MIKQLAIAAALVLPLLAHAGDDKKEQKGAKQAAQEQQAAPTQSAPTVKGNKQHQKMGACTKQAEAAKVTGQARKQFLLDCMKNAA